MERYNEYKDSGVQWLGEIPSHWAIMPLKYSGRFCKGKLPSETNENCLGKPIIGASEMNGNMPSVYSEDNSVPQCTKNDILFLWDGANAGLVSFFHEGIVASTVTKFTCDNSNIVSTYLYYLEKNYQRYYKERVGGTTIPHMNSQYIASCPLLIPSTQEQKAIADYLNTTTAKIDEAIAQQQKMIDLLNERKQIIINNAVTKGLNPDAPMKDSGVDWIGVIPEHWEVRKLKHIAKLKSGDTISSDSFTEDGFPVYGGNGFRGYTNRFTNDGEYVLIGRQGALCGNVNYATGKFFASEHAVVVYPYDHENVAWLGEVIRASNLNQYSQSAAQPGLAVSVIENIAYPYPPEKERTAIAEYLAQQMNAINAALHNIERQISLLQERKQIIINDVVTGKVKVS